MVFEPILEAANHTQMIPFIDVRPCKSPLRAIIIRMALLNQEVIPSGEVFDDATPRSQRSLHHPQKVSRQLIAICFIIKIPVLLSSIKVLRKFLGLIT
jgi:hypothetical protein